MSQINEDNAELVILTTEETSQSINIKKEQMKMVMHGTSISEETAKQAEENMQYYKDAEHEEITLRLEAEALCDSWNNKGNIPASEAAWLLKTEF